MSDTQADFLDGDLRVVVNEEEQYSIWPLDREIPAGWQEIGFTGKKEDCLEHIKMVWKDLRPLSLRKHMEETEENNAIPKMKKPISPENDTDESGNLRCDIVGFLSTGNHPIELAIKSERKEIELKKSIDQGYVVIRFLDTRGSTELGVRLERKLCLLGDENLDKLTGSIQIVGTLVLNDVRVRAIADINLEDLTGTGHLDPI